MPLCGVLSTSMGHPGGKTTPWVNLYSFLVIKALYYNTNSGKFKTPVLMYFEIQLDIVGRSFEHLTLLSNGNILTKYV